MSSISYSKYAPIRRTGLWSIDSYRPTAPLKSDIVLVGDTRWQFCLFPKPALRVVITYKDLAKADNKDPNDSDSVSVDGVVKFSSSRTEDIFHTFKIQRTTVSPGDVIQSPKEGMEDWPKDDFSGTKSYKLKLLWELNVFGLLTLTYDQAHRTEGLGLRSPMLKMLDTGLFSDFTIYCQETKWCVHRCILASRSPVLAAALSPKHPYKEVSEGKLVIDNYGARIVDIFIRFLYTNRYHHTAPSKAEPAAPAVTSLEEVATNEGKEEKKERKEMIPEHTEKRRRVMTEESPTSSSAGEIAAGEGLPSLKEDMDVDLEVWKISNQYMVDSLQRKAEAAMLRNTTATNLPDRLRILHRSGTSLSSFAPFIRSFFPSILKSLEGDKSDVPLLLAVTAFLDQRVHDLFAEPAHDGPSRSDIIWLEREMGFTRLVPEAEASTHTPSARNRIRALLVS